MTFGITSTGFLKKDAITIFSEIEAKFKAKFGDDLKTTGDSVAGNLIGITAEREILIWEQMEAVFLSAYVLYASGEALDGAVLLIGIARFLALYSTVTLTVTNSTVSPLTIPSGSLVKQSATGTMWQTTQEVIIPGSGSNTVKARATETGPFSATVGSIDTIVSLISGWDTVTNEAEAVPGRNRETDSDLRKRAGEKLIISTGGIGEAIANRLRNEVDGVTYVSWVENRTAAVVDGLAPHSYKFTIVGGTDEDIAAKIFEAGGIGIETNGDEVVTVSHDNGPDIDIKFDRADNIDIYLIVNITKDVSKYPADGDDLAEELLLEYGEDLQEGDDVINHYLVGALNPIPGITGLTIYQGTAPTPVATTTIAIASGEKAIFSGARITVNS